MNRRAAQRHPVSLVASLTHDGVTSPCVVVDLSLGGALIATPHALTMGRVVALEFSVSTMPEPIVVDATVRWSALGGRGVQFGRMRAREVWALGKYLRLVAYRTDRMPA